MTDVNASIAYWERVRRAPFPVPKVIFELYDDQDVPGTWCDDACLGDDSCSGPTEAGAWPVLATALSFVGLFSHWWR